MNEKEIISSGVLELYCMGLTSEEETAEVTQWAKQYPEVAAEIEAIQTGLESFAQTQAVAPAASVKDKVFAAIKEASVTPVVNMETKNYTAEKIHSISPVWQYAAAASIILLVGSLFLNYNFYNKYQTTNNELVTTQAALQQQRDIASSMKQDMGVIADKNAMPISLAATPDAPDAAARIYWMQNTNEVYIDPSNLPELEKGKQYQFWAIVDGKPVNGGIITTTINGKKVHIQKMKSFGQAQAFAVSVEDAGPEKPEPTKVVVVGKT